MRARAKLRPALLGWTATLALAGCGLGCGLGKDHPDVLLITIDTLRADRVGAYGYDRPTTPHLDRLAEEGALFETAYAPMGTTTPSHATLFTSRHPLGHGVVRNGLALLEAEQTLAEVLLAHGYTTAAFVSSFPVSGRFGLVQGFEHYDDRFEGGGETFPMREWVGHTVEGQFDRRGALTVDSALDWLARESLRRPFFLWVHLFDPHGPYVAPKAFQSFFPVDEGPWFQKRKARYDAEVRYADAQVGRLVEGFETALVIVTSDHGEGLSEHGWADHDRTLYEEEVRVPWIVRWPGHVPARTRLTQPVHLIDFAPTVTGLLGIDPGGAAFEGEDLSGLLTGGPDGQGPGPRRPLWLQRPYYPDGHPRSDDRGWGFGVRVGPWKLIQNAGQQGAELYHLGRDPRERQDLAAARPDQVEALTARIRDWRGSQPSSAAERSEEIDPEVRRALEALGYGDTGP